MKTVFMMAMLLAFVSCASRSEQKKVEEKVSQESAVVDGPSLSRSVEKTLEASKTLTEDQKNQLRAIFESTRTKSRQLKEESYKLKSVLVKELLAAKVDMVQVKTLKRDIKKVDSQRLKLTLSAIDEVTKIVKKDEMSSEISEHLLYIDRLH